MQIIPKISIYTIRCQQLLGWKITQCWCSKAKNTDLAACVLTGWVTSLSLSQYLHSWNFCVQNCQTETTDPAYNSSKLLLSFCWVLNNSLASMSSFICLFFTLKKSSVMTSHRAVNLSSSCISYLNWATHCEKLPPTPPPYTHTHMHTQ